MIDVRSLKEWRRSNHGKGLEKGAHRDWIGTPWGENASSPPHSLTFVPPSHVALCEPVIKALRSKLCRFGFRVSEASLRPRSAARGQTQGASPAWSDTRRLLPARRLSAAAARSRGPWPICCALRAEPHHSRSIATARACRPRTLSGMPYSARRGFTPP
jgi:hypothetical protein